MSAPYRTSEATLRAEVERLTRELATMRSPARRWVFVAPSFDVATYPSALAVVYGFAGFWATVMFISEGVEWFRAPWVLRAAIVAAIVAIASVRCFVRRVPVDGGGR